MRYVKITGPTMIEQLYAKVTCLYCNKTYNYHMKKVQQAKVCHCGWATFYFKLSQFKNHIGFHVQWIGTYQGIPEQQIEIEVDSVEIAKKWEVPLLDEPDETANTSGDSS